MRRSLAVLGTLCLGLTTVLSAHDMFLRLRSFFLAENTAVIVPLLNGTFSTSENSIDRNRIADISLIAPRERVRYDTSVVTARGDTTFLRIATEGAGTYVLGLSTRPSQLKISGKEFAGYLEEEGLTEVLDARKHDGTAADSASERYAKHVKAVLQVGTARSDGYASVLGYPAEIIPLDNPYSLKPGGRLRVRALVNGTPVANLAVLAGGRSTGEARLPVQTLRTGSDGEVTISVPRRGTYYVKFISMVKATGGVTDYVSNWATLTFQVR
jgi:uncharacterized protein DUF4198